jgi:hypothetical protein
VVFNVNSSLFCDGLPVLHVCFAKTFSNVHFIYRSHDEKSFPFLDCDLLRDLPMQAMEGRNIVKMFCVWGGKSQSTANQ